MTNFSELGKCNSFEAPNIYHNLNDQQFRLNKINEILLKSNQIF